MRSLMTYLTHCGGRPATRWAASTSDGRCPSEGKTRAARNDHRTMGDEQRATGCEQQKSTKRANEHRTVRQVEVHMARIWLLILSMFAFSCLQSGPPAGPGGRVCTPGTVQSCSLACQASETGSQSCNSDGTSYNDCVCRPLLPPACDMGATQGCSCPGRMMRGMQTCNSSRTGWDACACPRVCDTLTAGGATPLVTITLASALFGIAQTNGEEWDSSDRVAQRLITTLMTLLNASGQPAAAIVSQLLGFLDGSDFASYNRPDGAGFADIFVRGAYMLRIAFRGDEDSFSPSWAPEAGSSFGTPGTAWRNAPLSSTLNVRVTLRDRDLIDADDPAGTFVIRYDDICEALENGGVYQTRVAEMTSNQTLFFGFSVARQ